MKYLVATFTIETTADLMQASQDLLADGAAEAGFESFEETETGLEAYVQKELFDKEMLDAYIADFPIGDAKITYEVKDAEDKDWNQEWEEQGFEPIYVDNQVVIYDAKHPELYPDTSNRPDMIEIGIPFSDPMADGVVIQNADTQALRNGMTLRKLFDQLKEIRQEVSIPLILMGYLNPIMQYGFENFCKSCQSCGIDGVIIPDLPFKDYVEEFRPIAEQYDLRIIMLITPETSEARVR